MEPTIVIALITIGVPAFLAAVATPIVVAVIQSRQKRLDAEITVLTRKAEKEEEWNRADQLEARATARAAAVARQSEAATALLITTTANVGNLTSIINAKVDEVHVLVNSSYTAALRAALEAVQAKLVVLLDSIAFKREHRMDVDAETLADVEATKKKMEELTEAINERLRQDVIAKELKAKELLLGKQTKTATGDQPLPVADNRTATAAERSAEALERSADAQQRVADVTEEKK